MEKFLQLAPLVLFAAMMIGIGIYSRKSAGSVNDFVLGGRNVGPWLTAFAYGTSYFSAVVFVGYAGQFGWNFGISATWIGIGNAVIGSMIPWMLLGRRTRVMTKHFEAATMPEFFEKRYNSRSIKLIASVIVFVFLIPYSASVYKGLSGLFSMAFSIDFKYCIIGMAVLTGIYVVLGGYLATAISDFIQGIIMIGGILLVVNSVLNGQGGLMTAIDKLSQETSSIRPQLSGALTSFLGPDPINLLGVLILTSVGTWGLPQMVHKFYTIKNARSIRTGMVISTVFAFLIAGGSYFMGAFGRLYLPGADAGALGFYDTVVPAMLKGLPALLLGVIIVLVLSASMSTLSAIILTSSSTFTIDFVKGFFSKNMSNKTQILIIRILCVLFIFISVIIALNPNSLITTLMSISWGALAGSFLGPFLYGLFWKGATKIGCYAGFISGLTITLTGLVLSLNKIKLAGDILKYFNSPVNIGALAILVSLIVVPVVSLITPKFSPGFIKDVFDCYEEKVTAEHKLALEEVSE